jgi:predicted nucleotidyltransferase
VQSTRKERNSWITEIAKVLSSSESAGLHGITVYIFGSYTKTPTGRDIDLLIVYDNQVVALPEALHIRKEIAQRITEETGKQTHICLLSKDEREWLVFVKEENAKIIINQAISTGRWESPLSG